jgi:hypothetical protein
VYTEQRHVGGGYTTRPIGGGAHVTAEPVPVLAWAGGASPGRQSHSDIRPTPPYILHTDSSYKVYRVV